MGYISLLQLSFSMSIEISRFNTFAVSSSNLEDFKLVVKDELRFTPDPSEDLEENSFLNF